MPVAVLLLEPQGARLRVAPFVVLDAVVSAYLAFVVLTGPVTVEADPHALINHVGLEKVVTWSVLYVVAVVGPSVLSGYLSIVAFGLLNLVGLTVVALSYRGAFASVWCVYAALTSGLVLLHMVRRRRLPDPHRLPGDSLVRVSS